MPIFCHLSWKVQEQSQFVQGSLEMGLNASIRPRTCMQEASSVQQVLITCILGMQFGSPLSKSKLLLGLCTNEAKRKW